MEITPLYEIVKFVEYIDLSGTVEFCKNQIIKIGKNNYGFQFHFELTSELLNELIEKAPELKEQNTKQLLNDFELIKILKQLPLRNICLKRWNNGFFLFYHTKKYKRFINIYEKGYTYD
ncbi:MAG: hypothetical protein EU532_11405 [Promethearchaeota archaeon]|nr:MAG: hypothetical protein EU532_11405 [Candidatus Lokiarchaeota archaeon]